MQWGASTSNFYPDLTEDGLRQVLHLGFRTVEVFLNTESETAPAFLDGLRSQADAAKAKIVSVHPYLSGIEGYLLFSGYERRFQDGMRHYDRLFDAAARLGASYVVMHGDKPGGALPAADSIARFERVYDRGRTFGVTLLQENVVGFRSADPAYLRQMRAQLGDKAGFVLDFKQCRRCGLPVDRVIDAMGDRVRHVHISDGGANGDCLPPGQGSEDLIAPLRRLTDAGFDGAVILELYRKGYRQPQELVQSMADLRKTWMNQQKLT